MEGIESNARRRSGRVPVSVIIPCYRSSFIQRTLESVFNQTSLPEEVILVDDFSGDSTLETLRRIRDERTGWNIRIVALDSNQGQGGARNEGWRAATQPYIAFLDHDDSWHPRKLELQYEFMLQHPEVALSAHAWTRLHGAEGIGINEPAPGSARVTKNQLLLSNSITCTTVMARRSLPCRFRAGQRYMEDQLLWLEMASDSMVLLKMNAILSYTFKAPFGESGVSSFLWRQEKAELGNYVLLWRSRRLGLLATVALLALSVLKHMRRLLLVTAARTGLGGAARAHHR